MNDIAYRVEPGYRFPDETLTVTEERQRWLHACCDIPHGFYGDRADPSILAARPIKVIGQALFANYSDRGYVHTAAPWTENSPAGRRRTGAQYHGGLVSFYRILNLVNGDEPE
jgi:hypothetical protein